jgi:hypothetical protein
MTIKNIIKKSVLLSTLSIALLSACGPKEPVVAVSPSVEPSAEVIASASVSPTPLPTVSPSSTIQPTKVVNSFQQKEDFVKKTISTYSKLPYQGFVKISKDSNFVRFYYINEVVGDKDVAVKLHTQGLWMDIESKENVTFPQRQVEATDPENVNLNNSTNLTVFFANKCSSEYISEISKDIEKYSAYDYFKIIKEGYKVELIFGGREYDKTKAEIQDKYYKLAYRLDIDKKCEKTILTPQEKAVKPSY